MRKRFTLIELLVVIAIIAILASLLLPALQTAKAKAKQSECASREKQLALATHMYCDEYDEQYPNWNRMVGEEESNLAPAAAVWPYVQSLDMFICPAGGKLPGGTGWQNYTYIGRTSGTGHLIPGPTSKGYAWSGKLCNGDISLRARKLKQVTKPSETLLMADAAHMFGGGAGAFVWSNVCCDSGVVGTLDGVEAVDAVYSRHTSGENTTMCDGSLRWIPVRQYFATFTSVWNPFK
ncbi:MAG: hypothetical protein A3K19_10665 [Lentisphaerae bacterium RIFOXYB12_FULL_65_16]|nr:MAG: hypothetical protein A3K18_29815 [Lentisphaerae bacterium RIFOXYA12_64_32]OGV87915.1 MAG: hypothetical protein A3K19_10665 [Lentisphaerae bacterium RIFOXYB12_FULL_65_16]